MRGCRGRRRGTAPANRTFAGPLGAPVRPPATRKRRLWDPHTNQAPHAPAGLGRPSRRLRMAPTPPEILDVTRAQDDASSQHGVASVAISCAIRNTTEVEVRVPDIYIDGTWLAARGSGSREIRCPADGQLVATVDEAGPEDTAAAIGAARHSFDEGAWPRTSARER